MGGSSTIRFLGIDPASMINPSLAAAAILQQAALEREDLEVLIEAVHETAPTRAQQLRHILDIYLEGGERTQQAHGQIVMFVRTIHPLSWTRIYGRATELLLARQAQRFAESAAVVAAAKRAVTPPPAPPPTLASIFEKEPQLPKGFDPFSITKKELQELPSLARKLEAQVLLYRAIAGFALSVITTMEGLEENDYGTLQEIIRRVHDWEWNILSMVDGPLRQIGESAAELMNLLETPLALMSDKAIAWQRGIAILKENFRTVPVRIDETHGFYTFPAQQKYAEKMLSWLAKNSEAAVWNEGTWQLTATRQGKGVGKMWPPDLDNPALQTYLDLLGWKVEVEPAGEKITITVDFGNWRI